MSARNANSVVVMLGIVAMLGVAIPSSAQQNQSATAQAAPKTMTLSNLQRTGPGGDLAKGLQANVQGAQVDGGGGGCPQETCYECLFLDTYNPNNTYDPHVPGSDVINQVETANALTLGQPYLLTISGTVSYWGNSYYTAPIGNPETGPIYPSPAVPLGIQGYVASDWEYLFAYPNNNHGNLFASGPGHIVYDGISLDDGATFVDLVPLGGQAFHADHSYSYMVEGQGVQAKFQVSDFGPHSDNYGMYKICIYKLKPVTYCNQD
jgi:hypothetical protein